MQPPQQHSLINLSELKAQLIRRLGPERSQQYFYYLNRFLSFKLSKAEFNRVCIRTVGKDNIPLHNQLIQSILRNVCTRKAPPPSHAEHSRVVENESVSNGTHQPNGSIPAVTQAANPLALPNGEVQVPSPWKAGSGACEQRAPGPNGKPNYVSFTSGIPRLSDFSAALENGYKSAPRKPTRYKELARKVGVLGLNSPKFAAPGRSESGLIGVHRKEDRKGVSGRASLKPPLGVSIRGPHRASPLVSNRKCVTSLDAYGLVDTITLRERMEQIALTQGVQGVSMDGANALNNGLDSYLKGLIGSSNMAMNNTFVKLPIHVRPLNGVEPSHHYQIQSGGWPLGAMRGHEPKHPISLLDFRVAMELNPHQLGPDWPVMLGTIYTHGFEQ